MTDVISSIVYLVLTWFQTLFHLHGPKFRNWGYDCFGIVAMCLVNESKILKIKSISVKNVGSRSVIIYGNKEENHVQN
jgi:hypothetical protein